MFKVRVVGQDQVHEFKSRGEAFEWIRDTQKVGTVFQLLEFGYNGSLEEMNRFTFTGTKMVIENITK